MGKTKTDGRSKFRGYEKRYVSGGRVAVTVYLDEADFDSLKAKAEKADTAVAGYARGIIHRSVSR